MDFSHTPKTSGIFLKSHDGNTTKLNILLQNYKTGYLMSIDWENN